MHIPEGTPLSTSLRRMPNGNYYYRIRGRHRGHQFEKAGNLHTKDYLLAKSRLLEIREFASLIIQGKFRPEYLSEQAIKPVYLKNLIKDYLKNRESDNSKPIRASTLKLYTQHLTAWMNDLGPETPVQTITTKKIETYIERLICRGLSSSYINIRIRSLRTFWSWACGNYNWLQDIKLKQLKVQWQIKYVKKAEFSAILSNTPSQFLRDVFNMYIQTGCRRSEPLIGRVQGSLLIVSPELSKSGYQRIVALSESNIETILRMQASGYAAEYYSRKYKESCRAAGVKSNLHALRHAYAVRKWAEIRDLYAVSRLLGHNSINSTEIYARIDLRVLAQDFPETGMEVI